MPYVWFDCVGTVIRTTTSATAVVPSSTGKLLVPESVRDQVDMRMDVYSVSGDSLWRDGEEVDLSPDIPESVTSSQAKRALVNAGLYSTIESYISTADVVYKITWDAPMWYRNSEELLQVSAAIGLTDEQVDALFLAASLL